ncbi:MAG: hypothetical protein HZC41_01160 [Chloroflexi bacterium]|nr:hypothetical protein [Chloroflexota bacterium]
MVGKIRDTITGLWPVIKPYIPKPRQVIVVVLAFLFGLVWAYALDPVVFFNADPSQLSQSWQDEWVRLVAANYDANTANAAPSEDLNQNTIILLRAVDNPQEITSRLGLTQIDDLAAQADPVAARAPQPTIIGSLRPWILGSIVVAVIAVLGSLIYGFYINPMLVEPVSRSIRRRRAGITGSAGPAATVTAIKESRKIAEQLAKEAAAAPASNFGPPVSRHVSMYSPTRAFDDSFAIEDAKRDDEFLGECGAVISETIGVGDQERATAIEVWLFDKDDFVRTLTGVFASEYAYNDPAIRSKLDLKGPVVLAQPGAVITLETNTLRFQARIVDMAYGTGPLPPNSFFEKLTIELLAWRKDTAAVAQPVNVAPAQTYAPPAATPAYAPPTTAAPAFTPPPMPTAPLPSYTPPPTTPPPSPPAYGSGVAPLKPPPLQMPPEPPRRRDDDPFGGTGDWTPVQ